MKILAIETSCDETAIAVLEIKKTRAGEEFSILSDQVASQIKIHAPFGGVVPNLAKLEHIKNLPILLKRALKEARLPLGSRASKLDAVAVTYGPGLEPALWTGIEFAKKLARLWRVALIPVNHLEGHIYSALMQKSKFKIQNGGIYPMLTLIVSGGHTELVLTKKRLQYKILGETLDDAAGEAFDKVARMLKLQYPGGPEISKLAKFGNSRAINFPRPMIHSKDLNFSFSGLKTSVLYYLREHKKFSKRNIASSFEEAVVDVLVRKTVKAAEQYKPHTIALGGGVAANDQLREELVRKFPNILLPDKRFTGDNAAMIATAAYYRFTRSKNTKRSKNIKATGNLRLSKG
ncbi:tRNA (adenosine(37)-N6)-threonylcarbamoyltransferase complex transferase subunit TsaD [Candidatus Giovannonibacteria bacterium RIFCSPLOWO2_02_FULL_45_14]|uniref:tRNA N6-adenosine threonylcarbamoyltransferase n=1 Tax=Candidatus Giovannonibacteria bacterium RIFCSPLOWO2_12_FULL_44_15 TaxID=1798364 RepID=A0A1F5XZY7_9BACT|nr:MAG: tRNA (adenosine(37)-N6)-threonylcarbamoyltransferase complex transferase subunit TsaD [Candidatus Giovannonibacteria bacterium RIFCSPHIGHO2_12_FULL_44_29]OGF91053.1 MAG: tRNA (adenosine(37)-N6)-threonylcarbamoyltransferase complex transferase subunit TsaD [Candidatus Giovannonibacteria bacterium RIFCSPLOWO2_02_FULL_45_14]OGF93494.1 MAG: tRNA (adenosine(37)-N6)-threonylcarbamoyltransferase complex transferase subunit TsaD [Candidatus Giovannonibacteria bacterium RIFCSPLOWO2_12_FULL_44_15]